MDFFRAEDMELKDADTGYWISLEHANKVLNERGIPRMAKEGKGDWTIFSKEWGDDCGLVPTHTCLVVNMEPIPFKEDTAEDILRDWLSCYEEKREGIMLWHNQKMDPPGERGKFESIIVSCMLRAKNIMGAK